MNDTIITVENLSKRYRLGVIGATTLRDSFQRTWHRLRGRNWRHHMEEVGAENRTGANEGNEELPEEIWALKDVSFEVKRGEVLGVIGLNGAGKSTLLKLLSRITEPTYGRAVLRGRVGSLLEVGTGFHPELTGRENTYLNGAILGMNRAEIRSRFDEIVDFSGVEKFIDTPVKRYSSGMTVRLAFSVAAHLNPEILLVDEVLAVGDTAFQNKCLGKMRSVAKAGRTVLLVSHNMPAIRTFSERCILLDSGAIAEDGSPSHVVSTYLDRNIVESAIITEEMILSRQEGEIQRHRPTIRLKEIRMMDKNGLPKNEFRSDESVTILITQECVIDIYDLRVILELVDEEGTTVLRTQNMDEPKVVDVNNYKAGIYEWNCELPANIFGERPLFMTVHLVNPKNEHIILHRVMPLRVSFIGYNNVLYGKGAQAWMRPQYRWQMKACS